MGPVLRREISHNVPLVFWTGFSGCGFAGNDGAQSGFGRSARDRGDPLPGPAGRQRPVIRATHAGAAGAHGSDSHGRCAGGQPEPGTANGNSRPSGMPGGGRASAILVTGQQPVLSVSLLITS